VVFWDAHNHSYNVKLAPMGLEPGNQISGASGSAELRA
jgi:hypothetical protein